MPGDNTQDDLWSNEKINSLRIAVADNVNAMLAYWDTNQICRFANNAYLEWFGKSKEKMINKMTLKELLGPALYEQNLPHITKALLGERQTFERAITLPDGNIRHSIANYFPDIENGELKGFFVHVADVTSLKELELQLKENENVLTELNKHKDKLVSAIAHDLRSYFTINSTTVQYLLLDYDNISKEEILKYLQILEKNNLRTIYFLEDISDWVRNVLKRIVYKPQKINVEGEVKTVVDFFEKLLDDKNLSVKTFFKDGLYAYADPAMFRSIIRNLLSNAIKFSHPEEEIIIRTKLSDHNILVSIKDRGTGMNDTLKDNIISGANYQSGEGTKGEKGIGVGLGLIKEFIEKNGGTLGIESSLGEGSMFYFTVPVFTE
jgi:PAS domain S-box-containing protein